MSGIFPDGGVPAGSTVNGVSVPTANCPTELFYSATRCSPRFEPAAMNALISELLNLMACAGVPYDCSVLDNLCTAVQNLAGIPAAAAGLTVGPGQLVSCGGATRVFSNTTGAAVSLGASFACADLAGLGFEEVLMASALVPVNDLAGNLTGYLVGP